MKFGNVYSQFAKWTVQKIWLVARMKDNAIFHVTKVLIAQLLMVVIRKKSATKKSFVNMITLIRLHLMSYIALFEFIKDTYKAWRKNNGTPLAFSP